MFQNALLSLIWLSNVTVKLLIKLTVANKTILQINLTDMQNHIFHTFAVISTTVYQTLASFFKTLNHHHIQLSFATAQYKYFITNFIKLKAKSQLPYVHHMQNLT